MRPLPPACGICAVSTIRGHWSSCREPITLGCLSWFQKSLRCPSVFDLRVLEWVNAFSPMTNACLGAGLAHGNPTLSICQAPQGPWDLCRGSGLQRSPRESDVSAVASWLSLLPPRRDTGVQSPLRFQCELARLSHPCKEHSGWQEGGSPCGCWAGALPWQENPSTAPRFLLG